MTVIGLRKSENHDWVMLRYQSCFVFFFFFKEMWLNVLLKKFA